MHLAKTIDELFGRNDSRANANKAAQCLRVIQPKTTQIKYVGKTKRIQHVRTHGRDKRFLIQFQSVVFKLKTRYLKHQCIKSGKIIRFRSSKQDINPPCRNSKIRQLKAHKFLNGKIS